MQTHVRAQSLHQRTVEKESQVEEGGQVKLFSILVMGEDLHSCFEKLK